MCGILGVYPKVDSQIFIDTLKSISHRGPDNLDLVDLGECQFGHARLSIIDTSSNANQPMTDVSRRYTIVFNGEIYNFQEIRLMLISDYNAEFSSNSDTEVILNGFKYLGIKLFELLHGMFAISIYDSLEDKIFLVRDKLGIKPLLYYYEEGSLIFSSELKAFKILKPNYFKIRNESIFDFLKFGAIIQPFTIYENIQNLEPGTVLVWDRKSGLSKFVFSKIATEVDFNLNYTDSVKQLRNLLEKATDNHLISDVEVGCFLSGGVDSTAVLALMQKKVKSKVHAFSLGYDDKSNILDESYIAERSAKVIGARFTRKIVKDVEIMNSFDDFISSLDQPTSDGFNTYLISKEASKYVKVVLTGIGGDELFGGYNHFKEILKIKSSKNLLDFILAKIYSIWPNRFTQRAIIRQLDNYNSINVKRTIYSNREISSIFSSKIIKGNVAPDNLSKNSSLSYCEIKNYLLNTLLRDSDIMSMRHGLELRPILLDNEVVDFALKAPDFYKIRGGKLKALFIDSVYDLLPNEVLNRRKTGFELPLVVWMNGVLNTSIYSLWESKSSEFYLSEKSRNSLKSKTINRTLCQKDWQLVVLISWLEKNI
jgi:asparagine synthase (glutamine-hydrolysing)